MLELTLQTEGFSSSEHDKALPKVEEEAAERGRSLGVGINACRSHNTTGERHGISPAFHAKSTACLHH